MRVPQGHKSRPPSIEDAERGISLYAHDTVGGASHNPACPRKGTSEKKGSQGAHEPSPGRLSWRSRIRHFTWAHFTLTMATGGIANVLDNGEKRAKGCSLVYYAKLKTVPFKFQGLETIGIVVFLFNIVLFVTTWSLLLARFYYYPYTFKASFLHPTESLFIPASVVSFGTILVNISQYGPDHTGFWLREAVGVLFWINAALAVALSAGIYLILYVPSLTQRQQN